MRFLKALPAPLLLLMVGGALLYGLARWDAAISARDAALDRQTAKALQGARAWRGRLQGMEALAARDSALSGALRAANDSLRGLADAIAGPLDTLPEPRLDDAAGWRTRYKLRTVEVRYVRAALDKAEAELALAYLGRDRWRGLALAADSTISGMTVALEDERDARRCRVLGLIPCPSRGVMFVVGAAAATVTILAVR